ncbi:unnamed protein product [Oppiella nova]|uniref:XRN2-binding (XTBD) domain-containing protein n=1 Tax=Oppiella nova TaxID=334625 RepID=A0A7R9LQT1_9ACAR|nr:unnamed protein product [Oppiella nova]CAG2165438.1 unnamed protein product [Oppiella nova]
MSGEEVMTTDGEEYNAELTDEEVEGWRKSWEITDHWVLRRDFILTHKAKYPLDRLLCLAQTFVNINVLGNEYDPQIMKLIARLAEDVTTAVPITPDPINPMPSYGQSHSNGAGKGRSDQELADQGYRPPIGTPTGGQSQLTVTGAGGGGQFAPKMDSVRRAPINQQGGGGGMGGGGLPDDGTMMSYDWKPIPEIPPDWTTSPPARRAVQSQQQVQSYGLGAVPTSQSHIQPNAQFVVDPQLIGGFPVSKGQSVAHTSQFTGWVRCRLVSPTFSRMHSQSVAHTSQLPPMVQQSMASMLVPTGHNLGHNIGGMGYNSALTTPGTQPGVQSQVVYAPPTDQGKTVVRQNTAQTTSQTQLSARPPPVTSKPEVTSAKKYSGRKWRVNIPTQIRLGTGAQQKWIKSKRQLADEAEVAAEEAALKPPEKKRTRPDNRTQNPTYNDSVGFLKKKAFTDENASKFGKLKDKWEKWDGSQAMEGINYKRKKPKKPKKKPMQEVKESDAEEGNAGNEGDADEEDGYEEDGYEGKDYTKGGYEE